MELFDKKFVHFMWDVELKGKRGFLSSGIDTLIKMVNEDSDRTEIQKGCERDLPFCKHITVECRLAYYDPNYEVKKAFNEGKEIQYQSIDELNWRDVENEESFEQYLEEGRVFRIKPENEKKWIVYLNREIHLDGKDCYLTACREDRWGSVQKDYGAKTKLFIGSESEVLEWYKAREKFASLIKAWEDGKTIQVTPKGTDKWIDLYINPSWDLRDEYRVKPEEKKYRPYKDSAEMIKDFIARFKVNCPSYAEPLVWVKSKKTGYRYLITTFYEGSTVVNTDLSLCCSTSQLFKFYTYLDGSPCGMELVE